MMFDDLTPCPKCGSLGMIAPDLYGKPTQFHRIPSPRLAGYYTFTEDCQFI